MNKLIQIDACDRASSTLTEEPARSGEPAASATWPTPVRVLRESTEDARDDRGVGHLDGFLALIDAMSLGLKSGRIVARTASQTQPAFVLLDHGQMVHASFGRLEGAPAFRRMISAVIHQSDIAYRFEPLERWQMGSYPRSIRHNERQRLLQLAQGQEWGTQELEVPLGFEAREG